MGTRKAERTRGWGYSTSVLCLTILALAALPCFLWPLRIPPQTEEPQNVANAQQHPATDAQAPLRHSEAPPHGEKRRDVLSAATDPVTAVLRSIQMSDFQGMETVMTGRYLKKYQERQGVDLLETVDLEEIHLVSRGDGWLFLEARFTPDDELYMTSFPWEETAHSEKTVKLRLVKRNGAWKLEDARIAARP